MLGWNLLKLLDSPDPGPVTSQEQRQEPALSCWGRPVMSLDPGVVQEDPPDPAGTPVLALGHYLVVVWTGEVRSWVCSTTLGRGPSHGDTTNIWRSKGTNIKSEAAAGLDWSSLDTFAPSRRFRPL